MPDFESGVASYIKGRCLVEVNFPVDKRGNADVCCDQCPYFGRTSKSCQLNKEIVHYPKYIGYKCPLSFDGVIEEDEK